MAKETRRPPIHPAPKAGVASLTRKMSRERPLLKEKCLGWRSSASALKVGRLGPNPSPAIHQLSGKTGQVGSDVLESSEKMETVLWAEGTARAPAWRAGQGRAWSPQPWLRSAKQLVSPIQPERDLIYLSGTSFRHNHILQSCPEAQQYRLCGFSLRSIPRLPRLSQS
uniref:Uncharacterized protein n=1 Tax=Pipistrellus kuhlii TaxID=59472 RepID=A0A7J7UGJ0_PIPKU|nr:hypothetical protein mPipKuh1_009074 [Pipistrellus kuhlii]